MDLNRKSSSVSTSNHAQQGPQITPPISLPIVDTEDLQKKPLQPLLVVISDTPSPTRTVPPPFEAGMEISWSSYVSSENLVISSPELPSEAASVEGKEVVQEEVKFTTAKALVEFMKVVEENPWLQSAMIFEYHERLVQYIKAFEPEVLPENLRTEPTGDLIEVLGRLSTEFTSVSATINPMLITVNSVPKPFGNFPKSPMDLEPIISSHFLPEKRVQVYKAYNDLRSLLRNALSLIANTKEFERLLLGVQQELNKILLSILQAKIPDKEKSEDQIFSLNKALNDLKKTKEGLHEHGESLKVQYEILMTYLKELFYQLDKLKAVLAEAEERANFIQFIQMVKNDPCVDQPLLTPDLQTPSQLLSQSLQQLIKMGGNIAQKSENGPNELENSESYLSGLDEDFQGDLNQEIQFLQEGIKQFEKNKEWIKNECQKAWEIALQADHKLPLEREELEELEDLNIFGNHVLPSLLQQEKENLEALYNFLKLQWDVLQTQYKSIKIKFTISETRASH